MKPLLIILLLQVSCSHAGDRQFKGSTPANAEMRSFLGISLIDSVDFIRWKLTIGEETYQLKVNYGIGKPNTHGFLEGGKTIEIKDLQQKKGNSYILFNGGRQLSMAMLNQSLLHPLNSEGELMQGTGGWSYTLNSVDKNLSTEHTIPAKTAINSDSVVYQGRTPCEEFDNRKECVKKKWLLTLYKANGNTPGRFRTGNDKYPGFRGTYTATPSSDGSLVYQLNADTGQTFRFLLVGGNILVFTDQQGRLLVGDEDFSYTLSRR